VLSKSDERNIFYFLEPALLHDDFCLLASVPISCPELSRWAVSLKVYFKQNYNDETITFPQKNGNKKKHVHNIYKSYAALIQMSIHSLLGSRDSNKGSEMRSVIMQYQ